MGNKISIPEDEFEFSYSRSSGAGGQSVNKTNTKASLRWNILNSSSCPQDVAQRFLQKFSQYVVEDHSVLISSQRYRTQKRNKEDCLNKLYQMLEEVLRPPKTRRPTKPSKSSVEKRLKEKRKRAQIKKTRKSSDL